MSNIEFFEFLKVRIDSLEGGSQDHQLDERVENQVSQFMTAMAHKNWERAQKSVVALLKIDADNVYYLGRGIQLLCKQGCYGMAERLSNKLLDKNPYDPCASIFLIEVYLNTGRYELAQEELDWCLRYFPSKSFFGQQAKLYLMSGQFPEFEQFYQEQKINGIYNPYLDIYFQNYKLQQEMMLPDDLTWSPNKYDSFECRIWDFENDIFATILILERYLKKNSNDIHGAMLRIEAYTCVGFLKEAKQLCENLLENPTVNFNQKKALNHFLELINNDDALELKNGRAFKNAYVKQYRGETQFSIKK